MIRRPHLARTRRFALQVLALTAVILAAASTPRKSVAQAQSVEGASKRGPTKKPDGQLKEGSRTPASPLTKDEEGASTEVTAHCLSPTQVEDRDGDFKRNRSALSSAEFCIQQDTFTEGGLRWVLQIVYSKKNRHSVLWVVPHDNEDDAFDSAVYGLQQHGGTIVAVETGGSRFNRSQDPNRNFNSGTAKCPEQIAPSPVYTSRVMKWWRERTPIVALHTNERGYAGDGKGGAGGISIAKVPPPGTRAFRTAKSITAKSPDDTLVFVASTEQPENDANLHRFVQTLNQKGINVLYEHVSRTRNDCSLSNYAALNNVRDSSTSRSFARTGPRSAQWSTSCCRPCSRTELGLWRSLPARAEPRRPRPLAASRRSRRNRTRLVQPRSRQDLRHLRRPSRLRAFPSKSPQGRIWRDKRGRLRGFSPD